MWRVNVRSVHVACRALARAMDRGGDIVLLSGPDAVPTAYAAPAFATTQAAIGGFARAAAADLGPRGIRINVVAFSVLDGGSSAAGLSEQALAAAARFSALGRVGTAVEAARAVAWLALENDYITGSIVPLTVGL
jgi:3-oxoacyl-[acyl-carrier protein] reductase